MVAWFTMFPTPLASLALRKLQVVVQQIPRFGAKCSLVAQSLDHRLILPGGVLGKSERPKIIARRARI
jgi:hypothetical protein